MSTETLARTAARRRYLPSPLLVLRSASPAHGRVFFGYARNVSRSGLYISTVNPRQPGSRFHLEVPIPPLGRCVSCVCEVVWKRDFSPACPYDPGMGMKFIDLDEDIARIIDGWVIQQEIVSAES
jgi:hypothetical protein